MNASLRDLRRHVDAAPPPQFDVEGIVARGDARLRRRRAALAAGSAGLVLAVIVAGVTLTGSNQRSSPPVGTPTPSVTDTAAPTDTRPLTYADDYTADPSLDIHWRMQSIEYGDRTLRPGIDATALDLTDDGVVMVAPDGGIHLTDGEATEKIGESTIPGPAMSWAEWGVKTSTAGSLVAWFTPLGPDRSLVVYDAHEHRVVTQVARPDCGRYDCQLEALVGDRVYWSESPDPTGGGRPQWAGRPLQVLDVATETVSETNTRALWEDLRAYPRGFVEGDNYETGAAVSQDVNTGAVRFVPQGSTLELQRWVRDTGADIDGDGEGDGPVIFGYGGFDTTGRRLNLRLPAGYSPAEHPYALFQWLDDDRFAVMAGAADFDEPGEGYGDILVCDIARERCTLAAPGPGPDGSLRLVPHVTLPN
ncbi:hypothetical protein EKO23_04510 [Nocardioides guangzhouensis]|uniref:Uncharacterized protein n=1 Tax=Nocardioides guangzhouensis TaxID=2497878 RepID=A0A4Q4ZJT0_9ACTN|nr:hypothetical protein [Nocardioides guangzhouensis]RYP88105.1 hypothetical protein EKO23_04510 [Nocardioides guangzhouensis]